MDINTTIHFSEKDISEIINKHCEDVLGVKVRDVNFKIGSYIGGYGCGEHQVHQFEGVDVNCDMKNNVSED